MARLCSNFTELTFLCCAPLFSKRSKLLEDGTGAGPGQSSPVNNINHEGNVKSAVLSEGFAGFSGIPAFSSVSSLPHGSAGPAFGGFSSFASTATSFGSGFGAFASASSAFGQLDKQTFASGFAWGNGSALSAAAPSLGAAAVFGSDGGIEAAEDREPGDNENGEEPAEEEVGELVVYAEGALHLISLTCKPLLPGFL